MSNTKRMLSIITVVCLASGSAGAVNPDSLVTRVVRLETETAWCSGAIIDPRGYILTASHCVTRRAVDDGIGLPFGAVVKDVDVWVTSSAREEAHKTFRAIVVEFDRPTDLALLRIVSRFDNQPLGTFDVFEVAPESPNILDRVSLLGFPNESRTVAIEPGQVSGVDLAADKMVSFLRSGARGNPGSSGGPLVDEHGKLVGVHVTTAGSNRNTSLARPVQRIPANWVEVMSRDEHASAGSDFQLLSTSHAIEIDDDGLDLSMGSNGEYFYVGIDATVAGTVKADCGASTTGSLKVFLDTTEVASSGVSVEIPGKADRGAFYVIRLTTVTRPGEPLTRHTCRLTFEPLAHDKITDTR